MTRLVILVGLLVVELQVVSTWLDGAVLSGSAGLAGMVGNWGAWILRALVGFAAAFVAFSGLQSRSRFQDLLRALDAQPIARTWLLLHALFLSGFVVASRALYGGQTGNATVIVWLASGTAAILAALAAFLPAAFWRILQAGAVRPTLYSSLVTALALAFVRISQSMWNYTAEVTFHMVHAILRPVFPALLVQPEIRRLATANFGVRIDQACSGLEGAGLMLVFGSVWLFLYRDELRFPRALILVPGGMLALFLLNAVRIAALVVVGNAGFAAIAAGGFHSQAGWIAFNAVALAMTVLVPRIDWFRLHPAPQRQPTTAGENPTATFLLPFLAILAAGMVARSMSGTFEWLYPLRFFAALLTLWILRGQLGRLDWRVSWLGPTAGLVVLAIWVGFDHWNLVPSASMPATLAAATVPLRSGWILFRFLAAAVTVPIAEELAFRGFLMRRFDSPDFETIPLARTSWLGLTLSSLAFGFLHGDRWIAGVLAGLIFALVARRTNRIGDAALAHATTNALLGGLVVSGRWQYW